jgi:hypothetical protein
MSYKESWNKLPERVSPPPDELDDCQGIENDIYRMEKELEKQKEQLEYARGKLHSVLIKSWSKEEISKAGFDF